MYVERAKTEIENDLNLMEKFIEFQPCGINLSSFIDFELFIYFSVIFGCAQMRQPLIFNLYPLRQFRQSYLVLPGEEDIF